MKMNPIKNMLNSVTTLFTGIGTLLLCIVIFPVGLFSLDKKTAVPSSKTPILLIHGYLYNKAGWLYLKYRLQKAEVGPIFTMNLGYPFLSIEEYSHRVKAKALEMAQITGRSDIILIGHSMGGLVSSYYCAFDAPPNTVKEVITLGSPLRGSKLAVIGIGPCAQQMRCGNDFLEKLHEKVGQLRNTRFVNFGSKADWIVFPQETTLYSHPKAKHIVYPDMGHLQYLFSGRVADAIIEELN